MQEVFIAAMRIIKNIGYHRVFRITDWNYKNKFENLQDGLKSLKIELNTIGKGLNVT